MSGPTRRQVLLFLRMSLPVHLLGGALLTGIGAAIARYLAAPVDVGLYLMGQFLVGLIQVTGHYLLAYHNAGDESPPSAAGFVALRTGAIGADGLPRKVAQLAAIFSGGLAAVVATGLLIQGSVPPVAWLLLAALLLAFFAYSVPPVALERSGYGEVILSIILGVLLPAFGYVLQTGEIHRLVMMSAAPLAALHFAMLMAFELEDYPADVKRGKRTLMVRLGWETGMRLHDAAILVAIAALSVGFAYGLPWRVALGALIALPLALIQLWQMARIRAGAPPRWREFLLTASSLFGVTSYLILVGFLRS